jgi:hypothetical protein
MDPVLIVRLVSCIKKIDCISEDEVSKILKSVEPRVQDFSPQQLVRFVFTISGLSARVFAETKIPEICMNRATIVFSSYSTCPPRVVAKLAVSVALLDNGKQFKSLHQTVQDLIGTCISEMEADHVQQVCFALSRLGSKDTDLATRLTTHAILISPIKPIQTYTSLLVSLHRLPRDPACERWLSFKRVFVDHIGLGPNHEPHVSTLSRLLPSKLDEIHIRRIRNALVH